MLIISIKRVRKQNICYFNINVFKRKKNQLLNINKYQ